MGILSGGFYPVTISYMLITIAQHRTPNFAYIDRILLLVVSVAFGCMGCLRCYGILLGLPINIAVIMIAVLSILSAVMGSFGHCSMQSFLVLHRIYICIYY